MAAASQRELITRSSYETVEASHAGETLRLYVIGYEPGRPGGPLTIAEGRGITRSHFELVADCKTDLVVSDRIRLGRNDFTVVGLVAGVMNSGGDPAAFITLSDAKTLQSQLTPWPSGCRRPAAPDCWKAPIPSRR